jgi:hypothetical protein
MTLQGNIGGMMQNSASSTPYNQLSTMGNSGTTGQSPDASQSSQQGDTENNPTDKFVTDFGSFAEQFKNLTSSYKGDDEKVQAVFDALASWAQSVTQGLNQPETPSRMY